MDKLTDNTIADMLEDAYEAGFEEGANEDETYPQSFLAWLKAYTLKRGIRLRPSSKE